MKLPKFDTDNGHAKIRDPNNSAYVDSDAVYPSRYTFWLAVDQ